MYEDVALQRRNFHRYISTLDYFDGEDLNANRDGYMSKRQRAQLRQRYYSYRRYFRILVLVVLTQAVMAVLITQSQIWVLPVLFVPFTVLSAANVRRTANKITADLHKGVVSRIEGRIQIRKSHYSSRYYSEYLVVDDIVFSSRGNTVGIPRNGIKPWGDTPYVVYYLPNSRTILSLEPLDDIR